MIKSLSLSLRRYFSSTRLVIIGLFLLPLLTLAFVFRGVIFFGGFFYSADMMLANLPFLFYRGQGGAIIMQEMLSGFPLFVTVNASWFYPVSTFLFTHLTAPTAYVLLTVGNIFIASVFAYLYARKIGLSVVASSLMSLTYIFSGQVMLWSASIIMTTCYIILPAMLYLFEISLQKKWWLKVLLLSILGVVLGAGWISSQVQYVVYIHAFYFFYVAVRLLWWDKIRQWGNLLLSLAIPYIVSFLVGLPMIRAVLSFQPETLRAAGLPLSTSFGTGLTPWDFIHYALPFFSTSFFSFSPPNIYLGVLPLIIFLIALVSYKKINNRYFILFVAVFFLCVFTSIKYSPVAFIMHYLPILNAFREPSRIMLIGDFAAALCAGFGLDYMVRVWGSVSFYQMKVVKVLRFVFLYIALPVFALFTFVRLFFFDTILARLNTYFLTNVYPHTTGLPKEHYLKVVEQYLHQALDQLSFYDVYVVQFVAFFILAAFLLSLQKKLTAERFALLAVLLVSINFAFVYARFVPTIQANDMFAAPDSIKTIKSLEKDSTEPYRTYTVFPAMTTYTNGTLCDMSDEETFEFQKALLQPNSSVFYGIDTVEGYENFMPVRVSEALGYIGSESTATQSPLYLQKISLDEKLQTILARKNVLRMMNVKYVLSGMPLTDSNLVLKGSWKLGKCQNPVFLYELSDTWPRYFVTNQVVEATSSNETTDVFDEINSYSNPTVLVRGVEIGKKFTGTPFVDPIVSEKSETALRFRKVSCKENCALFIGNTYLPGWSATVDGAPATIYKSNFLYMSLMLPAGEHEVVLNYK